MFKIILKFAFYTPPSPPKYNIKLSDIVSGSGSVSDIKMQKLREYYLELNKQYYNNMTNDLKKKIKQK